MNGIETFQGRLDEFKRTLESGAPPLIRPEPADTVKFLGTLKNVD
jgi:hypothetical protein